MSGTFQGRHTDRPVYPGLRRPAASLPWADIGDLTGRNSTTLKLDEEPDSMSSLHIPIQLRPRSGTPHAAHAWLVQGGTADDWFAEVAQWNVIIEDFRFFALPVGLFVIPPGAIAPKVSPRTRPYCQVHEHVFIPIDADINPHVTSEDFQWLFSPGSIYVWHPRAGVLSVKKEAELGIGDLLAPVERRAANWSLAIQGVSFNRRVMSLTPLQPLSTQELWEDAQDDIGTRPIKLDELPPTPTEPSMKLLPQLGAAAFAQLAMGLLWLMKHRPNAARVSPQGRTGKAIGKAASPAMPSWGSGITSWARQQVANWTAGLEEARNREISRLLNLLDSDPDAGLRFAPPLSGEAGRGVAAPSSRLSEHNVDFSLSGGRGAVDGWNLSERYRQQLLSKYRSLANREIALGRHRRAAYIFAQLLGDFASAARTLADGGFYREAAVIYEEKLHQDLEAARCLENGRLWSEALALYEKLGRDEEMGDLYEKLERHDEATAAYRRHVERCLKSDDRLSAARVLQAKLSEPSEAIEVLFGSWPRSDQTIRCLDAGFKLLGRMGQHDEARQKIRWLGGTTFGDLARGSKLATCLASLVADYPDRDVQHVAADQTRLLAAEYLEYGEVEELTAALRKLVPEDRLLLRDTQRFSRKPSRVPVTPPRAARGESPRLLRQIALPPGEWHRLVACGRAFYAAGWKDNGEVAFVRGTSEGIVQPLSGTPWRWKEPIGLLLAADERFGSVVLHSQFEAPFAPPCFLPACDDLPPISVGGHPFLDDQTFACGYSDGGTIDALSCETGQGDIRWSMHSASSLSLMKTLSIEPQKGLVKSVFTPPALFQHDSLYLACGSDVCVFQASDGQRRVIELPHGIRSLTGSRRLTRKRLIASFEEGGMIVW
ncbi:MAG: hypothetical protein ACTHK7_03435, partial [Aureliella sp.]